ncbi:MAG TPA: hypothetical protein VFG89_07985 [Coriobacteriia bacterium]|nr:hypothetical protein [Coriobacteriia bacterium]
MYDVEAVLGPSVTRFVDRYVNSLLAWDIIVFFERNPDARLENHELAASLGRHPEQTAPEVAHLCDGGILHCQGSEVAFGPDSEQAEAIQGFVNACEDHSKRLALIAMVLHRIGPTSAA